MDCCDAIYVESVSLSIARTRHRQDLERLLMTAMDRLRDMTGPGAGERFSDVDGRSQDDASSSLRCCNEDHRDWRGYISSDDVDRSGIVRTRR